MKLRDHPLMTRASMYATWPPKWRATIKNTATVQGELGFLTDVSMNDVIPNKIFISMEHRGERYIALLQFDDEMFAKQLYSILLKNVGRAVKQVGDLDLSHLL